MKRFGLGLLIKLIYLEIGDRNDTRQLRHLAKECTQVVEVAVDLDLDRFGHDLVLGRIVTRRKAHHHHLAAVSGVLQALKNVRDLTLFGQKDLELFVLFGLARIQSTKLVDALSGDARRLVESITSLVG